jgi:carbamate kinase
MRSWLSQVVASPKPKAIVEIETIRILLDNKVIVIAGGGGGIPVVRDEQGMLSGREAVIDNDLAAALMAKQLNADLFVISTAVEKVCLYYGKPNQKTLDTITIEEAERYIAEGHFAPGSMLPKVQAIVDFVRSTVNEGLITDPANLYGALYEGKGTKIVR